MDKHVSLKRDALARAQDLLRQMQGAAVEDDWSRVSELNEALSPLLRRSGQAAPADAEVLTALAEGVQALLRQAQHHREQLLNLLAEQAQRQQIAARYNCIAVRH